MSVPIISSLTGSGDLTNESLNLIASSKIIEGTGAEINSEERLPTILLVIKTTILQYVTDCTDIIEGAYEPKGNFRTQSPLRTKIKLMLDRNAHRGNEKGELTKKLHILTQNLQLEKRQTYTVKTYRS